MLAQLLAADARASPCASVSAWWQRHREIARAHERTIDQAIAGGFHADRTGWAFASGYQAALRALFPGLPEDRICALCVTEQEGNAPRAIRSTLRRVDGGWRLDGAKRWTTLGPEGALFLVAARDAEVTGERPALRVARTPSDAPGVHVETMPPTKFVPEVPHARLRFEDVRLPDEALLPGDGYSAYVKPFRTVEDLHVHGAVLAYLLREGLLRSWPKPWVERAVAHLHAMRALADEDRDAPATHVALAGALAIGDALRVEADAHWGVAAEDEAARRWQRDRELLKVASSARTRRTGRAWERIAQESGPIAQPTQAETARAQRAELERAKNVLARQAERLRILHEIDRKLIAQESTEAIAAAVLPPLRELLGVPRVIVNLFDLAAGEVEWLAAAGRRKTRVGGVRYSIRLMGDLEALQRGETQVLRTRELPAGAERDALLASGVDTYMVVPMIAAGELIGGLSFGGGEPMFPEEQVEIARQAAAQLAIAIAQVRLFERVKRHAHELEERVRERTAELQTANQALEGFSYSVSHDLRAPLRAVSGYTQMLEEDYGARLDDEGRRLLRFVSGSAERMGQLIDGLLTFSRLGRQPVHAVQVEMRSLVREVADELAPEHPAAHINLGELPEATGDRMLLRQVWANLIGNALKYSAKNESPRVEIGGRADDGEIVYWVGDNGAGFNMRYADKLFRVFQRLHGEHEFSGTGVGLAIVERVIARHGGRVWAEGEVNRGAKFFFTLPRKEAQQEGGKTVTGGPA